MDNLITDLDELKDLPQGTVVIDCDGDAWQNLYELEGWGAAGYAVEDPLLLISEFLPVKVVYTPDED